MNAKKWFFSKKIWLRGGIIGIFVCLILSLFYLFLYFPLIDSIQGSAMSNSFLIPPLITGHAFPLFSTFIIPYGWLCEFTEPSCINWAAKGVPGATPWTLETGEQGYCVEQIMNPTSQCAEVSEMLGFWGLVILLFAIYFVIGAGLTKIYK